MPVVLADNEDREAVCIVFPKRSADGMAWEWEEVEVVQSAIEGFGLAVKASDSLDWSHLPHAVCIPLIGRETELKDKQDSDIFAQVLKGNFTDCNFTDVPAPPDGQVWMTDGCFIFESSADDEEAAESRVPAPDERVLRVSLLKEPSAPCVYLMMAGACELLHIPPAVLAVLRAHQHQHHTDRHFASHVAGFRRAHQSHMLINAHPCFGDAASAAGCINEPTHGTASCHPPHAPPTLRMHHPHNETDPLNPE